MSIAPGGDYANPSIDRVRLVVLVGLALMGLLAFTCAPRATAQTLPDPQQHCTYHSQWWCFPSLSEAEGFIRSYRAETEPERSYLAYYYTSVKPDGTTFMTYRVPDRPPQVMGGYGYETDGGRLADGSRILGPCTPAAPPSVGCASEEEVAARIEAAVRKLYADIGCQVSNFRMEGSYTEPFQSIDALSRASPHPIGSIQYGHRTLVYNGSCGAGVSEYREGITRSQRYQCEPRFVSHLAPYTEEPDRWPTKLFCKPNSPTEVTAKIQTGLRQLNSCPANENPCIPATGDKVRYEKDFAFAGRRFVRTYHSQRQFNSPTLPPGWTHTYSDQIIELADGTTQRYAFINGEGELDTAFNFATSTAAEGLATRQSDLRLFRVSGGFKLRRTDGEVKTFDRYGRLTGIEHPSRPQTNVFITYDLRGRIATVRDSSGRELVFSYVNGVLSGIQLPDGSIVSYEQDATGNLSAATVAGLTRRYHYDQPGQLVGITGEDGVRYANFSYDARGRVISSRLSVNGNDVERTTLSYPSNTTVDVTTDGKGTRQYLIATDLYRSIRSITKQSGSNSYVYDASYIYQSTDPAGNVTRYQFSSGRLTSVVYAYGTLSEKAVAYQYDANNRFIAQDMRSGSGTAAQTINSSKYVYDSTGALTAQCLADASVAGATSYVCGSSPNAPTGVRQTTFTRCSSQDVTAGLCPAVGLLLASNGPRTDVDDVTTYAYHNCTMGSECGQVRTITDALGHVTTYNSYNDHGQPLSITDPNGAVVTLTYDERQHLSSRAAGTEVTRFEYWPTGLPKRTTLPDGSYVQYEYDTARRLTGIHDSEGNRIHHGLDASGSRISEEVFDPSNSLKRTRSRVYDILSRLEQEIGAGGTASVTTTYGYDGNGNLTSIAAPLGRNTISEYDELDRLSSVTDPENGLTTYGYDALDQVIWITDPRNLTTTYTYSGLGELKQQVSPDTGTTTNSFDSSGNLLTSTDARGAVTTYTYDALNRAKTVAYAIGSTTDQTITYEYDVGVNGKGRLTGASDSTHSLAWTYDEVGRLLSIRQNVGAISKAITYAYTNAQRSRMTTPSGQVVTYAYSNGRLTGISVNGTVLVSDVLYDPFGPVKQWTWGNGSLTVRAFDQDGKITQISSGGVKTYSYDDAFRITGIVDASSSALSWIYGYDELDRLTSASKTGTSLGYSYDANGNRLTQTGASASTLTIAADSNRLMSTSGALARTYGYDNAGNATSFTGITFAYNNRGRMKSSTKSGVTTNYTYNALGQLIKKGSNSLYYYDEAGHIIGIYNGSGALVEEIVWLGDIPIVSLRPKVGGGINIYYIHTDHLNTPRLVTGSVNTGARWRWDAEPFGGGTVNNNPTGAGAFDFNLRFPGQIYFAETSLNYNYFRDYDPAVGRYVESDPIGLEGGLNTYAYTDSNPVAFTDPLGLDAVPRPGVPVIIPPAFVPGTPEYNDLVDSGSRFLEDVMRPIMETSRGNVADTQIKQDYEKYASAERLCGNEPKDRCTWLDENKSRYRADQVKATQKAWGCRRSRALR